VLVCLSVMRTAHKGVNDCAISGGFVLRQLTDFGVMRILIHGLSFSLPELNFSLHLLRGVDYSGLDMLSIMAMEHSP